MQSGALVRLVQRIIEDPRDAQEHVIAPARMHPPAPVPDAATPEIPGHLHPHPVPHMPQTTHLPSIAHQLLHPVRGPIATHFAAHTTSHTPHAWPTMPPESQTPPPPEYSEEAEYPADDADAGPEVDAKLAVGDVPMPSAFPPFGGPVDEPPLTRAEVYRSLTGCYEECGKQVQAVAGQVAANHAMVGQLAGRIAAAEDLMTNHVAKVEERVQVLETTVEQELQSPGRVSNALEQLAGLKAELSNMQQLMDEHPLQVAHRLLSISVNPPPPREGQICPKMGGGGFSNTLPFGPLICGQNGGRATQVFHWMEDAKHAQSGCTTNTPAE